MAKDLIRTKSVEDSTDSLVSFLPGGRPFLAARLSNTKLRSLLTGLATELLRVDGTTNEIGREHDITATTQLIEEWERALGIPDSCFSGTGDLATRREHVRIKLAAMGLQSEQDFIDLAALFGYTVQITAGADRGLFPFILAFPIFFFAAPQDARYTQIVTIATTDTPNVFALDFPIRFGSSITNIIQCLMSKLVPANVNLVFEYTLPDEEALITESGLFYLGTEDGDIFLLE